MIRSVERSLLQAHVQVLGTLVNMVKDTDGEQNTYYSRYHRNTGYKDSRTDEHGATVS